MKEITISMNTLKLIINLAFKKDKSSLNIVLKPLGLELV